MLSHPFLRFNFSKEKLKQGTLLVQRTFYSTITET
nr:MAG TPA: hypothetical protein [Caudoviricetes sp.]